LGHAVPEEEVSGPDFPESADHGVWYDTDRSIAKLSHADSKNLPTWLIAVRAAESKKATDIKVLDLTGVTSFADYFVICSGSNQRQIQAISDEIGMQLKQKAHELPKSVEGYNLGEWVLSDYGDLLVHVFSEKARHYYDLERLWRSAKVLPVPPE
jgi:ribosome-associated protein